MEMAAEENKSPAFLLYIAAYRRANSGFLSPSSSTSHAVLPAADNRHAGVQRIAAPVSVYRYTIGSEEASDK